MTNLELTGVMIDLGRRDFYYYCKFRMPKIYNDKRPHLKVLCKTLQDFYESETNNHLILNMPPRFGKTLTVELLTEWILGKEPTTGVMVACYNERLSTRFSKQVRGDIQEIPQKIEKPVFKDYFPGVKIKDGDGEMTMWSLENSHFSFLATSPGGTATGVGAQILIIDDLIKNALEAYNDRILEEHEDWYNNTILSRLEKGAKQIIIQTRWATGDLSGRLIATEPDKWTVVKMKAQNDDGSMLCEDILTKEEFEDRKTKTDPVIIEGNYQQEPYDSQDKLYPEFKTYQPGDSFTRIESYCDTADTGSDSLAGFIYGIKDKQAYILDVLFTTEPMEVTEVKWAKMINERRSKTNYIESNNGGRGFSRTVEQKVRALGNVYSTFKPFTQHGNKVSRILTGSSAVMNCVHFPLGWELLWPKLAQELKAMSRASKWKHDDAADGLTGIVEKSLTSKSIGSGVSL